MSFYLDASAIIPVFVNEAHTDAMERFVGSNFGRYRVSEFASGEVASAFSRLVRMNELSASAARVLLDAFDRWRLTDCSIATVDAADISLAATFVRRFDLKLLLPDAIHLAASQRQKLGLVTFDDRLANAAAALGVDHIVPV